MNTRNLRTILLVVFAGALFVFSVRFVYAARIFTHKIEAQEESATIGNEFPIYVSFSFDGSLEEEYTVMLKCLEKPGMFKRLPKKDWGKREFRIVNQEKADECKAVNSGGGCAENVKVNSGTLGNVTVEAKFKCKMVDSGCIKADYIVKTQLFVFGSEKKPIDEFQGKITVYENPPRMGPICAFTTPFIAFPNLLGKIWGDVKD